MALRPDGSDPGFAVVRKGYDPDQVRTRLRQLDDEISALRARAERAERAVVEAGSMAPAELTEAVVASRLGDEAARVLTTAHQAAVEMRQRAEEHLQRALREAQDDAGRIRSDAELEGARRRADAIEAADAEIEAAKQQGREMLAEAHAVREKVLADLARRREAGRRQLEQLKLGRDRLLSSYDVVRRSLAQVTDELVRAVPEAQELSEGALARPLSDVRPGEGYGADVPVVEVTEPVTGEVPIVAALAPKPALEVVAEPGPDEPAAVSADPSDGPEESVDDLFARLRAARTDAVAAAKTVLAEHEADLVDLTETIVLVEERPQEASAEAADAVDATEAVVVPEELVLRRATLAPIEQTLTRHLKRALADEQNDVLDRLRKAPRTPTADVVFGEELDHLERYRQAAEADLRTAAIAGARHVGARELEARSMVDRSKVVDGVLADVAIEIAAPLRARLVEALERSGEDADEATGALRAIYREWKTQRLDGLASHVVLAAFERAMVQAAPPGTCLRWMIDPSGAPCPDAEDNALAGVLNAGDAFPTGHVAPPAHLGCTCHLQVVAST